MAADVRPSIIAPFTCEVEPHRDRVVVRLSGEFDLLAVTDVEKAIGALVDVGFRQVCVDLRALTFMDSSGLRVLMAADHSLRSVGGQLLLTRGSKPVDRLLGLTGTDKVFAFEARPAGR